MMARRPRKIIKEDVLFDAWNQMFTYCGIEATTDQQQKLFYYLVSTLSKYMLDHADTMIKLGPYICIEKRGINDKELFSFTIPYRVYKNQTQIQVRTADEIYKYYTKGYYEADKLRAIVESFIEHMVDYSNKQEKMYEKQMKRLKSLEKKKKK